MYLLYLDESGVSSNARHFVLAGVVIYENSVYWVTETLNDLQARHFPGERETVRFHAAPLRARDGERVEAPFDRLNQKTRREILEQLYGVAQQVRGRFFAAVVEKSCLADGEDPYERALEELLSRFDLFLNRMYRERSQRNKGLVVIADSQARSRLESVGRQFLSGGTRWSRIHNVLDIPFFTLSQNSRLLQVADLVANTVYGRYESGYANHFDRMLPKFDQARNGPMHGLVHIAENPAGCYIPCCYPAPSVWHGFNRQRRAAPSAAADSDTPVVSLR